MKTVNMHEAKTHLSKLVQSGEPFIIARAGKPVVMVTPFQQEPRPRAPRLGILEGQMTVPEEFFAPEFEAGIKALFRTGEPSPGEPSPGEPGDAIQATGPETKG